MSFDRLNSLSLSGIDYPQEEFPHIQIKKGSENVPIEVSLKEYDAPEQRFCPAHVYEYVMEMWNSRFTVKIVFTVKHVWLRHLNNFYHGKFPRQEDLITRTCN